jgi:hypothetical protein
MRGFSTTVSSVRCKTSLFSGPLSSQGLNKQRRPAGDARSQLASDAKVAEEMMWKDVHDLIGTDEEDTRWRDF